MSTKITQEERDTMLVHQRGGLSHGDTRRILEALGKAEDDAEALTKERDMYMEWLDFARKQRFDHEDEIARLKVALRDARQWIARVPLDDDEAARAEMIRVKRAADALLGAA